MFGFGKKKTKREEIEIKSRTHVIPDIFYGGNDPVIYHRGTRNLESSMESKKKIVSSIAEESWFHAHKKTFFIVSTSIVALVVGGMATWYYIVRTIGQLRTVDVVSVIKEPVVEVPLVIEEQDIEVLEDDISTTTIEDEEVVEIDTSYMLIEPVSFPRILLVDSPDNDSDQLTDAEEEIFLTNPDLLDSDGDGYHDSQEILNLYNPNMFAPVKIIDSGLVKEYINPIWRYRLYYPTSWQIGEVDKESRQVLFSTISGDFIEVRVFDRINGQSFQEWFAVNIEGEKFQDLNLVINRFKEEGMRRKDGLVGYFVSDTHVTVLIYHPGVMAAVPYRNVMRMVFESFRSTKNFVEIEDQVTIPLPPTFEEDSATTTYYPDDVSTS